MDERLSKLSNTIVNYSVGVKENDKVLIQYESSMCKPLIKCLIKDIYKNKGIPFVKLVDNELETLIKENANSEVIDGIFKKDNVSRFSHLLGAISGFVYGYYIF